MTRRLATLGTALLALTAFAGAPALAADAVPVAASWTQLRLGTPAGPLPDLQSADGEALPVQNGALGAISISAVRISATATSVSLARTDAAASASAVATPAIWACAARSAWTAGNRQPWADRPTYDCAVHAVGKDRDGIVRWDLTALSTFGQVDVVLVPDPADTSAYAVTFGVPVASSFSTAAEPSSVTSAPVTTQAPAVPDSGAPPIDSSGTPGLPGLVAGVPTPALTEALAPQTLATSPPSQVVPPQALGAGDLVAATRAAHQWMGPALLAFLALLLMIRTALPSASTVPPSSLLQTSRESETS
jgi:hypothetical protein